jgi:hypothetical protein
MLGSHELTPRQERVLRRLCETPDYVSFHGHAAGAAHKLATLEFAVRIAPDKWGGVIYQASQAGRDWVAAHAR